MRRQVAAVFLVLACWPASLEANGGAEPSILGGQLARAGQFPYIVVLRRNGNPMCGGSIVSGTFVLTAAHCVFSGNARIPAHQLSVRAGSNRLSASGLIIGVQRVVTHPQYRNLNFDVAVLRLVRSLPFSPMIRAIQLRRSPVPAGAEVTIAGWGLTSNGGRMTENLRFVQTRAMSDADCWRRVGHRPTVICLLSPVGRGACRGDSGGPGVTGGELAGVTSFGRQQCGTEAPDGYAKIAALHTWITQNMR